MSKKITALYERSAVPNPEHIRRQRNNLETFAQSQGFTNLQHFTDDGYAANNYDRPGFTALWAQMQLGEIGTIIVTDMARLSRDLLAISTFRDMLQMKGIRLIAILEKVDFLPDHIHDDDNGLDYTRHGDYYLPDIEYHTTDYPIGRWGQLRRNHLAEHHHNWYWQMALAGTLNEHIHSIDQQAKERYDLLMDGYIRCWGITEELKAQDQMKWVGLMNQARAEAEHNIMAEIVLG